MTKIMYTHPDQLQWQTDSNQLKMFSEKELKDLAINTAQEDIVQNFEKDPSQLEIEFPEIKN